MLTTGVAISIPEPFGSLLRQKRAEFGDPMAETVPTHVTLMPPMPVRDERYPNVCETLAAIASSLEPFAMRLRGTGTFRPVSPVVFVAVCEGISQTEILAWRLRASLALPATGFPFHPHVTVAHNLDDVTLDRAFDELSDFECQFEVNAFHLYLHTETEGWTPQHEFLLDSGDSL